MYLRFLPILGILAVLFIISFGAPLYLSYIERSKWYEELLPLVTIKQGVYGKLRLREGDCMPNPSRIGPCATVTYPEGDAMYFINVDTEYSYSTVTGEGGFFQIELPNGEYAIILSTGRENLDKYGYCFSNLTACSNEDYNLVKEIIDNMPRRICKSDPSAKNTMCRALVHNDLSRNDLMIDNVVV